MEGKPKTDQACLSGKESENFEWIDECKPHQNGKVLDLQYVTENGKARPKGTIRNLIRSHARLKKSRKVTTLEKLPAPDRYLQRAATGRGQPSVYRNLPGLLSSLNGILEPFDCLPIRLDNRMQSLLNHWDTLCRQTYNPFFPRKSWLPFAISDAVALNTVLFIAALSYCAIQGYPLGPDIFYYKGETIKLINDRLKDRNERTTDAMILAVACLAHIENKTGTPSTVRIHINALEMMVKSRGGLRNVKGTARYITARCDSCAAVVLNTRPRFDDIGVDVTHDPKDWSPYSELALRYQRVLLSHSRSPLSIETIELYWGLRNLTKLKDEASSTRVRKDEFETYMDILETLERRLVKLIQEPCLTSPIQELAIYKLFGYAALQHSLAFIHDQFGLPLLGLQSDRMREVLEAVDVSSLAILYPEMMLWILVMGGIGGFGSSRRIWWANRVAKLCFAFEIKGVSEITARLAQFFWTELYLSPATETFWADVAAAQGIAGGYKLRRLGDDMFLGMFNTTSVIGQKC